MTTPQGKPPATAMQEDLAEAVAGIHRLEATVATLGASQEQVKAQSAVLADCRTALLNGQTQHELIRAHLDDILHLLTQQRTQRRRRASWLWASVSALVCAVWFVAGWEAARWVRWPHTPSVVQQSARPAPGFPAGHATGGKR